jgi:membrane protein required for colicin V production
MRRSHYSAVWSIFTAHRKHIATASDTKGADLDHASFIFIDYLLILITGLSVLLAFASGFVATFLSLARTIAAFGLATWSSEWALPLVTKYVPVLWAAKFLAFFLPFITCIILLTLVKSMILSAMEKITGGAIDRSFGALFGLIRGAFIVSLTFFVLSTLTSAITLQENRVGELGITYHEERLPPWLTKCSSYPLLRSSTHFFTALIPPQYMTKLTAALQLPMPDDEATESVPTAATQALLQQLLTSAAKNEGLTSEQLQQILDTLPPKALIALEKALKQHHSSPITLQTSVPKQPTVLKVTPLETDSDKATIDSLLHALEEKKTP